MTTVTIENFYELLPEIKRNIYKSCFIAIDSEFTGLHASASLRPSLFDTSDDRYKKCRQSVGQHAICQFGLAAYVKAPCENRYDCHAYSFYLCPRMIDDSFSQDFTITRSSIEFLSDHGFDFNMFLKLGIPYLNEDQAALLESKLKSKDQFAEIVYDMYQEIMDICAEISKWENEVDRALIMAGTYPETRIPLARRTNHFGIYLLLEEIRCQYPHLWIDCDVKTGELVAKFMQPNDRAMLLTESAIKDRDRIVNYLVGFSRVFQAIVEAKKPLVGHNMFFDLLFMYHHFYKPLPKSVNQFKRDIRHMFPTIFDTKHLLANIPKDQLKISAHSSLMDAHGLGGIFLGVSTNGFNENCPFDPIITRSLPDGSPEWNPSMIAHDAGFDAYACGYLFIRLAHNITYRKRNKERKVVGPIPFGAYLQCLQSYANQVNLIRATVHCINLEGPDAPSSRPSWLVVRSSKPGARISLSQVMDLLSMYGKIDVRLTNDINGILVAVPAFSCARDMLKDYGKTGDYRKRPIYIQKYNPLRHRKSVRIALWSSLIGSTLITGILFYRLFK